MDRIKKKQKKRSRAGTVWWLLRGSKLLFALGIFAGIGTSLCQIVLPRIIGVTVDSIIGDKKPAFPAIVNALGGVEYLRGHLMIIALILIGVGAVTAAFRYISQVANARGAETLSRSMRERLFDKVERLPLSWHAANRTGDIIQRCTSDTETIRGFVADQLTQLVNVCLLIMISLFAMFWLCPVLAWITLATVPVVVTYSAIFYFKTGKRFEACDENEGILSAIAQENLTGSRVVKAFGREDYEREKFEKQNQKYTNLWIRMCRILSVYWGVGDFVAGAQMLAVLAVGTVLAVGGTITPGDFITFISYNTMLIWPIRSLGRMIADMSKAGVSVERIRAVLNADEEDETGMEDFTPGDIVFDHVTFAYEKEPVIRDVSFSVKEGSVVGILGGTGSGKSTLALLLSRLYEPSAGTISVGGKDIRRFRLASLRRNIGFVMQEPFLYSGTLLENIDILTDSPDLERARDAARAACLDETAMGFAEGYETVVGERGVTLSGGQKQRTAIARMLTENAPIMVFDDSLSAVDTETDEKIRAALKERFRGATVILISHRINTLMSADQILVLDKGRVAECGTHDELRALHGIYDRVCGIQLTLPDEMKTEVTV